MENLFETLPSATGRINTVIGETSTEPNVHKMTRVKGSKLGWRGKELRVGCGTIEILIFQANELELMWVPTRDRWYSVNIQSKLTIQRGANDCVIEGLPLPIL